MLLKTVFVAVTLHAEIPDAHNYLKTAILVERKCIVKKVQSEYFEAVSDGRKPFEVRLADFRCKPGDTHVLHEQAKGSKELTGRTAEFEILYHLNTKRAEKFYTKEEIAKHGLLLMGIRKQYRKR